MKRPLGLLLLSLPLAAQGTLFQEDALLPPTVGVNVQVGFPRSDADRDLNHHVGYGVAASYCWHLGGRQLLRPSLEYNTYRITPPGPPAWASDADRHRDFYSWTLAVDYLVYQEPWVHRGPYVLASAGFQYSSVTYQVQNGTQEALTSHRSSRASPWFGVGLGYQITDDIALELRYSAAAYAAEKGQPLTGYAATEEIKRNGRYVHLILALRVPL